MSKSLFVCADHFEDGYLAGLVQAEIDRVGSAGSPCSICGPGGPGGRGTDLEPVIEIVEAGLRRFYVEGDDQWDGPIPTSDALYGLAGIDDEVVALIVAAIGECDWVPAKRSGHNEVEMLAFGWEAFEHHIRHVSRFLLDMNSGGGRYAGDPWFSPAEVLPAIAEAIRAEADLVTQIDKDTKVFRARTFNQGEPFTELHELVSPPPGRAAQGRMNAAGVSVLYAALDRATAVAEVYDGKTSVAMVTLRPMRDLRVLDLTSIAELSPYDPAIDARRVSMLGFLRSFARAIAQPIIRDDRVHHEYAPTQMASEFFRWRLLPDGEALDGIIFPSSRAAGRNVVLFAGQQECLSEAYLKSGSDRAPGCAQLLATDPIAMVLHYEAPQATPGGVLDLTSQADIRDVF